MAKAAKSPHTEVVPGKPAASYLAAAFHALQAGDVVHARRFAQQVLAGRGTVGEAEAARHLATTFSTTQNLPEDVAAEIIRRTKVPAKAFLFAALTAAIFLLLLTLAVTRYKG